MKNRKIICIILMIFLTFFITKQAYAEQDNEINENGNRTYRCGCWKEL